MILIIEFHRIISVMNKPAVKEITALDARPHRQAILRPGQPVETVIYEGDDAPSSAHFAVFLDSEIVAIATLVQDAFPLNGEKNAWRMRGVATYLHAQKRGYGSMLIQASVDYALSKGGKYIWCNARNAALIFYKRNGFTQHGKGFDIPGAGIHYMMYREII